VTGVDVTAPGKLIALVAVIVGCFAFLVAAVITSAGAEVYAVVTPVLTLVVGYLVGNGTGARHGFVSVPPFQPKPKRQLEVLQRIVDEDEQVERDNSGEIMRNG